MSASEAHGGNLPSAQSLSFFANPMSSIALRKRNGAIDAFARC